ncbi:hypothetical protein HPP92_015667 [Vanilla planifolia]|uniref:FLZ-type domain-containing protein n=1 Tax=Vanilla planifolia TaxID=51239 RepID=A0A835QHR3_VANPL|nr:hypothetical protein HPP92_016435 [Vanilla planifolia]KAG0471121.1 hypothetical protein HPP92_015667 [Vanilla planifolia]
MRRTTSLTEFAADLDLAAPMPNPSDLQIPAAGAADKPQHLWGSERLASERGRIGNIPAMAAPSVISRRGTRRSSFDFAAVETAPFLRACGLCKRRLSPVRDIFMYRGEIGFCSLECRQQQMNLDERKEKFSLSSTATATASDPSSGNGETVAAA